MKIPQIAIFLSIVSAVYTLVNLFLFYQTRPLFSVSTFGFWLKLTFFLVVLSYPLGRTFEVLIGGQIPALLVKIGSIWLAFMLYLTLLFMLFHVMAPLVNWLFKLDFKNNVGQRQLIIGIVYFVSLATIVAGYINAITPKVNHIEIKTTKIIPNGKLKLVMASDIHLGTIIGKNDLAKLVGKINAQNPDIVLFAGDIFDEDIAPVVNGQMGKLFETIKSQYGVYAVTGNHELYSNLQGKIEYLQNHGVKVLTDTVISTAGINIIGRYDRQSDYTLKRKRKSLKELTQNTNKDSFTLVLEHQPLNLDEAVEVGADLQLSGHTHHGQMWPLNYITSAIYEISKGYEKRGHTHFYVSPGYGTWGPRVRIGNRPEIAVISISN